MDNKESTILIVDDLSTNLEIIGQMLQSENYSIMVAQDGETALELVSKSKPDLILLDIMMPYMDGFEVCKVLKQNSKTSSIPIIFVTALKDTRDIVQGFKLGAVDYVTKPFNKSELLSRVRTHVELKKLRTNLESVVESRTKELFDTLEELKSTHNQLENTYLEIIKRLARASDYRDNETGLHILRMSNYSEIIGRGFGFDDEYCKMLLHASKMHDVGKIGIPDSILLKPGKLNKDEFEIMKTHCTIGSKLLSGIDSDLCRLAEKIALTHHEKYNGKGYPNGLSENAIPIEGRIVAVADVFDALTSNRPYKKAWSVDDAIDLLVKEKNEHFDANIVDIFIDNIPHILEIKVKFADTR